jgi:hypothetical protein
VTNDPHKPCAALEHLFRNYSAVWCQHRQQWTVTSHTFQGAWNGTDVDDFTTRSVALGPFDTARDAVELLVAWVTEDLERRDEVPPRPSGS